MSAAPVLIYLHGFNSSPNAFKAQCVELYIKAQQLRFDYLRPSIPDLPDQAILFLDQLMDSLNGRTVYLIGGSLGGFYATWLADKYRCKAVLVNPSTEPHTLLHRYGGAQRNPYSGNEYSLTSDHMEAFKSVHLQRIMHPERYFVLLQMGDEVLDAQLASRRFQQSRCVIEAGGDHMFQDFQRFLPAIFAWFTAE